MNTEYDGLDPVLRKKLIEAEIEAEYAIQALNDLREEAGLDTVVIYLP